MVVELKLAKGQVAVLNKTDYDRIMKMVKTSWYLGKAGYPTSDMWINGKKKNVYLHRLIMNAPKGLQVEHKDGNPLNCRKRNLRFSTQAQNMYNKSVTSRSTSGYKGVYYFKGRDYWYAKLQITDKDGKNKSYYIGNLATKEDAARAYNVLAKEHFGKYARLNVIKPN